jgi:triosephosphate isomerase
VSARQAKSVGAEYAIVGHSERRKAGDTNETVGEKARQALEAGMRVIACVGETERDHHAKYLSVVREQVRTVLLAIEKKHLAWVTIAYEPVWAIGKGYDTALKASDIHEMTIFIKKVVAEFVSKKIALKTPVLYGGSLNFENAQIVLRDSGCDGLLVGRQSLDSNAFCDIISYANSL